MTKKEEVKKGVKEAAPPEGKPQSAANTLEDNEVTASEMQDKKGGKQSNLAAADADTAEQIADETAEEKKEEDNSVHARLSRTSLVLHDDQNNGRMWVGVADGPCRERDHRCRHTTLAEAKPVAGTPIIIGGEAVAAVPFDIDRNAGPEFWLTIMDKSGKPVIESAKAKAA